RRTRSRTAPSCCGRVPRSASRSDAARRTRFSPSTGRRAHGWPPATLSRCARGARRSRSCARRTGPTTTCCAPSSAGASGRRGRGMLRTVRVRDLALIEELELALEPGLNVITGETGAGKSILLQALDVALGGRPDADLVRTGAEEAAVEALFAHVPAEVGERLA